MNEKTAYQVQRFLKKVAEKFPPTEEPSVFTDIHVRVSQDTGDVMAYNDADMEITRCVVEEWIDYSGETDQFYDTVAKTLRLHIADTCQNLGIVRPYNFVLETETGEHVAELYVADDEETTILSTPFMENLSQELDSFIDNLLKEDLPSK